MSTIDYILIALLVVAAHRALRHIIRNKGGCGCGCSGCKKPCNKREEA